MGFLKYFSIIAFAMLCSFSIFAQPAQVVEGGEVLQLSSGIEEVSLNRSESKIRNASVVVRDIEDGSYGSGTLFKIDDRNIIITAKHVVGNRSTMAVVGRADETVVGTVIYVDPNYDFAMLSVPDMITREPMRFRIENDRNIVGMNTTYTGHPAGHDLLTLRGRIAGIDTRSKSYLMHGYAWMGASGSCVFSLDGKLIGVLYAVDVGRFYGPHIVEDIIWITPISEIDIREILLRVQVHGQQ